MKFDEKPVPITEELSLSPMLIHYLLSITFRSDEVFQIIEQSGAEAYDKWKDYKYDLTKEEFKDILSDEMYNIYIEKIIKERNK